MTISHTRVPGDGKGARAAEQPMQLQLSCCHSRQLCQAYHDKHMSALRSQAARHLGMAKDRVGRASSDLHSELILPVHQPCAPRGCNCRPCLCTHAGMHSLATFQCKYQGQHRQMHCIHLSAQYGNPCMSACIQGPRLLMQSSARLLQCPRAGRQSHQNMRMHLE